MPSSFQLDGIWHTGVVVYGTEYYFGGGIQAGPPAGTHFGRPVQVIDLGHTQVPKDLFLEFLEGVSSQYSFETYDLMSNNCNNFSNAAAEFLLGRGIPGHIVNLPQVRHASRRLDCICLPCCAGVCPAAVCRCSRGGGTVRLHCRTNASLRVLSVPLTPQEVLSSPLAPMLTPFLSQMSSASPLLTLVSAATMSLSSSLRTAARLPCTDARSADVVFIASRNAGSLRVTEGGQPVSHVSPFAHHNGPAVAAAAPLAQPPQAPSPAAPTVTPGQAAAAAAAARERDMAVAASGGTPAHDTGAAAPPAATTAAAAAGSAVPAPQDDEAKRAAFKAAVAEEFARLRKEKPELPPSEAAADAVAAVLLRVEAGEDI